MIGDRTVCAPFSCDAWRTGAHRQPTKPAHVRRDLRVPSSSSAGDLSSSVEVLASRDAEGRDVLRV